MKKNFTVREHWNRLLREMMASPSMAIFKTHLTPASITYCRELDLALELGSMISRDHFQLLRHCDSVIFLIDFCIKKHGNLNFYCD